MPITIKKEQCSGCHACAAACPKQCICMKEDREGFLYPVVDSEKCIHCGICERLCPVINRKEPVNILSEAYAAVNPDDDVRLHSSSGGIFTVVAESVIEKGGVVFGAAFDENFHVFTTYAEKKEDLAKFRGSKYVQSVIGDAYKQAKFFLDSGREVLFSGTPCQIGGLYAYLAKNYENLITIDLICHGVPSPLVWRKYIEYRRKVARSDISKIELRNKTYGWRKWSVLFEFSNNTKLVSDLLQDHFIKVFLGNYCLRPSCYHCSFKTLNRFSDITVADFWGVENLCPEMDDGKGTSLILVHSLNGKRIMKQISEKIVLKEQELMSAVNYNPACLQSASRPKERDAFIEAIQKKSFNRAFDHLVKGKIGITLRKRIRNGLAARLKKIKDIIKR